LFASQKNCCRDPPNATGSLQEIMPQAEAKPFYGTIASRTDELGVDNNNISGRPSTGTTLENIVNFARPSSLQIVGKLYIMFVR
jgi:hypothetical protein